MSRNIIVYSMLAMAFAAFANSPVPAKTGTMGGSSGRRTLTPAERAQRRAARQAAREARLIADGGLVTATYDGHFLKLANGQKKVGENVFKETAQSIHSGLRFPIAYAEIPAQQTAAESFSERDGAVVALVSRGAKTPMLIVAPEAKWAEVNVDALAADGIDAKKLEARVMKELWRATVYVLGAANSSFQPCLMRDIHSLAELDAVETFAPCPEPFNKMMVSAAALKIRPVRTTTYKRACEEGWAPAPTNAVQKAIWEKVRAEKERGPTSPITIPPPKK